MPTDPSIKHKDAMKELKKQLKTEKNSLTRLAIEARIRYHGRQLTSIENMKKRGVKF